MGVSVDVSGQLCTLEVSCVFSALHHNERRSYKQKTEIIYLARTLFALGKVTTAADAFWGDNQNPKIWFTNKHFLLL